LTALDQALDRVDLLDVTHPSAAVRMHEAAEIMDGAIHYAMGFAAAAQPPHCGLLSGQTTIAGHPLPATLFAGNFRVSWSPARVFA